MRAEQYFISPEALARLLGEMGTRLCGFYWSGDGALTVILRKGDGE